MVLNVVIDHIILISQILERNIVYNLITELLYHQTQVIKAIVWMKLNAHCIEDDDLWENTAWNN